MSSLAATLVRPPTLEPLYTPSRVSKLDPTVSIVAVPLAGAVQRYQIECPPALPTWLGSPASLVAPTLVPVRLPLEPLRSWAAAKLSLAGGAPSAPLSVTEPLAAAYPSTPS